MDVLTVFDRFGLKIVTAKDTLKRIGVDTVT